MRFFDKSRLQIVVAVIANNFFGNIGVIVDIVAEQRDHAGEFVAVYSGFYSEISENLQNFFGGNHYSEQFVDLRHRSSQNSFGRNFSAGFDMFFGYFSGAKRFK